MEINGSTSDGYHTFDELYEHRHWLFLALMSDFSREAWYSRKHDDGTEFEGWFIAGIKLKTGQITYHLPIRLLAYAEAACGNERKKAPRWDGHTSTDVIERLKNLHNILDVSEA